MGTPETFPLPDGETTPPLPAPPYSLFDSASVTLATLLGSPIAGTILMAVNYRRLEKGGKAVAVVGVGLVATILAVLFASKVPAAFSACVAIGLLLATRSSAQILQGPAVNQHLTQGGKIGSRWAACGMGVAALAASFGGAVLVIWGLQFVSDGRKITIGTRDAVYYSGSATEAEAKLVGEKLKSVGFFTDRGVTLLLSKDKGGSVASFVVREGAWNDPETVRAFALVGCQIAPLMGVSAVKMRMVDQDREVKKEVTTGKVIIGTKDEIFYFGSATEADAQALGKALIAAGLLGGGGLKLVLSKGDGTAISVVVSEHALEEPTYLMVFEQVVRTVAPSVGGLPIKLRLLNFAMETKKEVSVQ